MRTFRMGSRVPRAYMGTPPPTQRIGGASSQRCQRDHADVVAACLYPAVASKFVGHPPMTLPRRQFLHLAAGAAALPAMPRIARAQPYPSRPVRIIIPFPAGQATDTIPPLLAHSLSDPLRHPSLIWNHTRP